MAKVDYKARLVELRTALDVKQKAWDECADAVQIDGDKITILPEHLSTSQKLLAELGEIKSAITITEARIGSDTAAPSAAGRDVADQSLAGRPDEQLRVTGRELKSLGEMFTSSEAYDRIKRHRTVPGFAVSIGLGDEAKGDEQTDAMLARDLRSVLTPGSKDIFSAAGGNFTNPAFGHQENSGIIPRQHRTQRIRDLFPVATTTANLIEYLRVSGFTNNAATVRERYAADGVSAPVGDATDVFGLKPSSNLTFTPVSAPVRTIAHNIRAHRNTLDDEPRLQAIINGELLYGLQLVEDTQLLSGDGTGENVTGLLNTSGIQTQTQAATGGNATEKRSKTIRKAITKVLLAFYEPTGIVLNPLDWEDIELEEDANGRYMLIANVSDGLGQRLWRLPVVDTAAIPQNTGLVGAFGLGARVWDRMQANVQVSTEDRDNFIRNAITIQAEERIALEVGRPESFVQVTMVGEPT